MYQGLVVPIERVERSLAKTGKIPGCYADALWRACAYDMLGSRGQGTSCLPQKRLPF
jgi:hypothetical protein